MNKNDLVIMLRGMTPETQECIVKSLSDPLSKAISLVNGSIKAQFLGAERSQLEKAKLTGDMSAVESAERALNSATLSKLTEMRNIITPPPELIFNAFRLCPIENTKVVLLGQDPYIKKGEAQGLSFSVPKGVTVPPSLRNIYKCLIHSQHMDTEPTHGDLTAWAKQGVLMFNTALTTTIGKSNAHMEYWSQYTDEIIKTLSSRANRLIFILFGKFAQSKANLIDKRRHSVLEWGHPSPLNNANKTDNPKHFKYCNVFSRANDILVSSGQKPIAWNPDHNVVLVDRPVQNAGEPVAVTNVVKPSPKMEVTGEHIPKMEVTKHVIREVEKTDICPLDKTGKLVTDCLYVFTDGGSSKNGAVDCKSSWAFYMTNGVYVSMLSGIVPEKQIEGKNYTSSNNRGELTAILMTLMTLQCDIGHKKLLSRPHIYIISDSEYSIGCLTKWYPNWTEDARREKKNVDIISAAYDIYKSISTDYMVEFRHTRSHQKEPTDLYEKFIWKGNCIVDDLCNVELGRK